MARTLNSAVRPGAAKPAAEDVKHEWSPHMSFVEQTLPGWCEYLACGNLQKCIGRSEAGVADVVAPVPSLLGAGLVLTCKPNCGRRYDSVSGTALKGGTIKGSAACVMHHKLSCKGISQIAPGPR